MERIIAYSICCRSCVMDKLLKEGFNIIAKKNVMMIQSSIINERTNLGRIYDSDIIIYPEINMMDEYSISERTRLIRMCDELKV